MADLDYKAIPEITLLRSEEDLDEWSCSVDAVMDFYTGQFFTSGERVFPRNRSSIVMEKEASFLLGMLSASVSPVAGRLVKAGWNFADVENEVADLYDHVLKVFGPASQLHATVAELVTEFSATVPAAGERSLMLYKERVQGYKRRLDDLGCPMDEKMAISLVLNSLATNFRTLWQELITRLNAGNLDWDSLMGALETKP